jgi:hypothetical protein
LVLESKVLREIDLDAFLKVGEYRMLDVPFEGGRVIQIQQHDAVSGAL